MNNIELHRFSDLSANYQKLLPALPSGVNSHGVPVLEKREGRWAMFIPEKCITAWGIDPFDGKYNVTTWADGWEHLGKVCSALDSLWDPSFVRLTDNRVLVFGCE